MRPFVFENPPLMETPDGRVLGEYLARQFFQIQQSIESNAKGITWEGKWKPGQYCPHQLVLQDGWLAIPNKCTTEEPAPVSVGDVYDVRNLPGTPPAWTTGNLTTALLIYGQRYTFPSPHFIRNIQYYLDANNVGLSAEVWMIVDPLGTPEYRQLIAPFTIIASDTGSWRTLPIGSIIVPENTVFDVLVLITSTSGVNTFSGNWVHNRTNGTPAVGEIAQNNQGRLRVSTTDADSADRSVDLANLVAGSVIEKTDEGISWEILNVTTPDPAGYREFEVQPTTRGANGLAPYDMHYYGTLPIYYPYVTNWYTTTPGVQGFVSTDYDPDDMTLDENLYGIDIGVQQSQISEDWDLLAYSG